MALSKNKLKLFQSLQRKKNRDELGLFIAEGEKLVKELISANFKFHTLIYTRPQSIDYSQLNCDVLEAGTDDLKKISSLKTPPDILAICYQSKPKLLHKVEADELIIALDDIQDPGNLGTIIRLASWFGIKQVVCSPQTADCYNQKVIQATMGAIAHVSVAYTPLAKYLTESRKNGIQVYGTFLEGNVIYESNLASAAIVVMGNEGNGISDEIRELLDHKLFIPSFSKDNKNVESLNVSMATAIVCSEFKRRTI
ncbi:MAG: TrmH family RNA methyltransferase [Prolixibacteraceae bacterium]